MAAGHVPNAPQIAARNWRVPWRMLLRFLPPAIVFVLLLAAWELGVKLLNVPVYTLPAPSTILQTIPTIDELRQDAIQTALREALPGFIIGSGLGFIAAVLATRYRFLARGIIPYGVISNSIPIIGYRGLTSVDALSLQLMQSYAAGGVQTFFRLRIPASLPYVFNGLKINTTLAMIGAIVGEFFGSPFRGLGYYINNEAPELQMPQAWSAVVVACAIGIFAYLTVALLERIFTSWHVSYRSGR
jgi:NitT/TauT family transport system permease protein